MNFFDVVCRTLHFAIKCGVGAYKHTSPPKSLKCIIHLATSSHHTRHSSMWTTCSNIYGKYCGPHYERGTNNKNIGDIIVGHNTNLQYITLDVYIVGYSISFRWKVVCIWEISKIVTSNSYSSCLGGFDSKSIIFILKIKIMLQHIWYQFFLRQFPLWNVILS